MLGEETDETDSNNLYSAGKPKKKKKKGTKSTKASKTKEKKEKNHSDLDDIEITQDLQTEDTEKKSKKKNVCQNCKSLKQKIKELEQLNRELLKVKDKLSKNNDELISKNNELNKKSENLSKKISELTNTNSKLTNLNNALDKQISQLSKEKNDLQSQNTNLKEQINSFYQNNSSNNTISSNIKSNENTLTNNDSKANDSFRLLKSLPLENKNQIQEFKNDINELKKKILELEKFKKIMEEKDIKYNEKFNILENNIKNININDRINNLEISDAESEEIEDEESQKNSSPEKIIEKNAYTSKTQKNLKSNCNKLKPLSKSQNIYQLREKRIKKLNNIITKNEQLFENIQNSEKKRKTSTDFNNNKNQKFNSKIIKNLQELNLIAKGIVKDDMNLLKKLRVGYKLLYRASEDGDDAEIFHQKCDGFAGTLTVIKTKENFVFGGYTSVTWDTENEDEKKDMDSFVFSINLEKIYYVSNSKEFSIYCDVNKGPSFIGMFSIEESMLSMVNHVNPWGIQCYSGEKKSCEINGGKNEFYIEDLEVFQVIVKKCTE